MGECTHIDAAEREHALLPLLRQLPDAYPWAPRILVSWSLQQQVASILRQPAHDATACAQAADADEDAEVKHCLCRAGPELILRAPLIEDTAQQAHSDEQL